MNSLTVMFTHSLITPLSRSTALSIAMVSIISFSCFAQPQVITISGLVVDSISKSPLPGANVYIGQTTFSTITTDSGTFELKSYSGSYNLVVSYVGYKPFFISLDTYMKNKVPIQLIPNVTTLQEVSISGKASSVNNLAAFKMLFLGNDTLSCRILNPEVLKFQKPDTSTLLAKATKPLVIENLLLGYKVYYDLTSFKHAQGRTSYTGYTRFEEIPADKGQKKLWDKNRLNSYQNSPQHFLYSLVNDKLKREGFAINKLVKTRIPSASLKIVGQWSPTDANSTDTLTMLMQENGDGKAVLLHSATQNVQFYMRYPGIIKKDAVVSNDSTPNIFKLSFDDSLIIYYHGGKPTDVDGSESNYTSNATSIITMLKPNVSIDKNGNISDPNAILYEGYWAKLKIQHLIPLNYSQR